MDSSNTSSDVPSPHTASIYDKPMVSPYMVPVKRIKNQQDLEKFLKSHTCKAYVTFIEESSKTIVGVKVSDTYPSSPVRSRTKIIDRICDAYTTLSQYIDEIPPIQQPMRYGNKAFRTWLARVREVCCDEVERVIYNMTSVEMMIKIVPENLADAAPELAYYWVESFGNSTRIDYGTGHEMFMAAWLFGLKTLGAFQDDDTVAIILSCFNGYMKLMRKIQRTYMLEPAGSHGVWSLDDYHALPFVFGSAQFLNHKYITPKGIKQHDIVADFSNDYLYLACIKAIMDVKSGPFHEHSPILAQSAEAASWMKVHQGMLKIYFNEVIGKYPVMQHFLFGSILPFPEE